MTLELNNILAGFTFRAGKENDDRPIEQRARLRVYDPSEGNPPVCHFGRRHCGHDTSSNRAGDANDGNAGFTRSA